MPETKRPLKVFLCHAHADRETVRALYARLKREGVDVWLDKEKLLPGADWELEIRQAVHESDVVVVCLSKQFNQAGFRQKEVKLALDTAMEKPEGEIFIIPARLEECEGPENLSKWHWVDLFEEDGHQRLIRALRLRADRIGATLRIRKGGPSSESHLKDKELERPTESPVNHVNIGDTLIDIGKQSIPEEEKAELGAVGKDILEEVESEKARKAAQQKVKRESTERTKPKRVKRPATKKAPTRETLSAVFTRLNSILSEIIRVPGTRRILGFTGIVIVLLLFTFWAARQRFGSIPTAIPSATTPPAISSVVAMDTSQETQPVPTEVTPPLALVPGGADKIAFVANGDIWLMNVDGSDLKQLTSDGGAKTDLQWLQDGETIIFISGLTIKYVNILTRKVETLTSFPSADSLNAFRVSHDGKQVMISLNNEIFVVPFAFDQMKNVHKKSDLLALNGCISPDPNFKYTRLGVRESLWSAKDELVAWLFKNADPSRHPKLLFDQVSVLDISKCSPAAINHLDNFPSTRFKAEDNEPVQYNDDGIIPSVDWDGNDLFVFNTNTKDGWGELYVYNWNRSKGTHSNQVDGVCCYRDARWSPDGLYLLFAFQDQRLGAEAPTLLYYVVYHEGMGTKLPPLPLPEGFFKNRKEAPQPALRPIPTPQ